jgi:hypothetical protein
MIKGWQPKGYLIHYVKVGGTCLQKIFCFEKVFLHPLLLFCLLVQNVTCSNSCKCIPSAVIKTLPYMPTLERLKAVGGDLRGFAPPEKCFFRRTQNGAFCCILDIKYV